MDVPGDIAWLNPMGWMPRFDRHRMIERKSRAHRVVHTDSPPRDPQRGDLGRGQGRRAACPRRTVAVSAACASPVPARIVSGRSCGPTSSSTPQVVAAGPSSGSNSSATSGRPRHDRCRRRLRDAHVPQGERSDARRPRGARHLRPGPSRRGARLGAMFPIEGDRWIVTLQGAGGDTPPTDDAGFVGFARSLRSPILHDAIRFAEPLTPAVAFANTANRRRHFERLRRWPEGFVVVGDGVCAFNPIYGQGMAVAAQTAVVLGANLATHLRRQETFAGFARRMQRRVAGCGDAAWMIATGDDLRLPTTTGAKAERGDARAASLPRPRHDGSDERRRGCRRADRRLLPPRPADVAVQAVGRRSRVAVLGRAVHRGADLVADSAGGLTSLLGARPGRGSSPADRRRRHRAPGSGRGRGAATAARSTRTARRR